MRRISSSCPLPVLHFLLRFIGARLHCSVRVSNELGAGHPRVAKFSVLVVNGTSILISILFSVIVLVFKVELSELFTSDTEVIEAVSNLTPLLAISVFLNGVQPILSGNDSKTISSSTRLKKPATFHLYS